MIQGVIHHAKHTGACTIAMLQYQLLTPKLLLFYQFVPVILNQCMKANCSGVTNNKKYELFYPCIFTFLVYILKGFVVHHDWNVMLLPVI